MLIADRITLLVGRNMYGLWEAVTDAPRAVKVFVRQFVRVASFGFFVGVYVGAARRTAAYYLVRLDDKVAHRQLARKVDSIEQTLVILSKLRSLHFIPQYMKKDIKKILRDTEHLRDCALEFSGQGTSWRFSEVDTTSEGEAEMGERASLIDKVSQFPAYVKIAMLVINGWAIFFLIAAVFDFFGHPMYGMVGWLSLIAAVAFLLLNLIFTLKPSYWSIGGHENGMYTE